MNPFAPRASVLLSGGWLIAALFAPIPFLIATAICVGRAQRDAVMTSAETLQVGTLAVGALVAVGICLAMVGRR